MSTKTPQFFQKMSEKNEIKDAYPPCKKASLLFRCLVQCVADQKQDYNSQCQIAKVTMQKDNDNYGIRTLFYCQKVIIN